MYVHVIFMLIVFIFAYWRPTGFPYQKTSVSSNSNTTGVTCGAGTSNPSRAHEFTHSLLCGSSTSIDAMLYQRKRKCGIETDFHSRTPPGFLGVPVPQSLVFCVVFYRSLYVLFPLVMCCLSLDSLLLIGLMVSLSGRLFVV
jgi:hypothetical protein